MEPAPAPGCWLCFSSVTCTMSKVLDTIRASINGEEKQYTSGSIRKAIVLLSIPMILEMVMESLFAIVDVFFVSKVGVNAVTTVGLTESVITIIYSLAWGISMAATAMVSRRIGEKNPEAAANAATQAIILTLIIGITLGIAGVIFAGDILSMMGASPDVLAYGIDYARISFASSPIILLLFLLNGIFRGAGDAAIAMYALWIANAINIILDPLLIFGVGPFPELGVQGAAVATVIGRSIGIAFQVFILLKGKSILPVAMRHLRVQWAIIRRLLNVSITGAGQFIIASASWIFLMRIIAFSGSEAVAGYTIAIRIIVFTILPSWGLANAAATLVGQNLGAGHPERAEASVWKAAWYNTAFLFTVSIIFFSFAPFLIRIFNDNPVVIEAGVLSLRIICTGYIFFAFGMVITQAFNGAGDTRTPTLLNLLCFWAIEIPLGYILAVHLGLGLAGVCWSIAGSETLLAILSIWLFKKGNWKKVAI
jgi:putative MATE family efflux protein